MHNFFSGRTLFGSYGVLCGCDSGQTWSASYVCNCLRKCPLLECPVHLIQECPGIQRADFCTGMSCLVVVDCLGLLCYLCTLSTQSCSGLFGDFWGTVVQGSGGPSVGGGCDRYDRDQARLKEPGMT
uniref:Uncharacterized protein n=1 Tax=Eutreptiella gymnastica TaxID=73025 RepID=A0A7S1J2V7_9EUGL|mmetsp:Transcript_62964/g.112316  ORF Transcript_62964/g.112316 Transcript_62964/m.112316 type:complete len:127 (+) Transcript_62964:405-785(+)